MRAKTSKFSGFVKLPLVVGSLLSVSAWAYRVEEVNENVAAVAHRTKICAEIVGDYLDFLSADECQAATLKVSKRFYDVVPSSNAEELTGYAWTFAKGELTCNGNVTLNIKQPTVDSEGRVKWVANREKWSFNVEKCGSEALNVLKKAQPGAANVKQVGLQFDAEFPWEDGAPEGENAVTNAEIPRAILQKINEEVERLADRPDYNWVKSEHYQVFQPGTETLIGYIAVESIHNSEDGDDYTYEDVILVFDKEGRVVADQSDQ